MDSLHALRNTVWWALKNILKLSKQSWQLTKVSRAKYVETGNMNSRLNRFNLEMQRNQRKNKALQILQHRHQNVHVSNEVENSYLNNNCNAIIA